MSPTALTRTITGLAFGVAALGGAIVTAHSLIGAIPPSSTAGDAAREHAPALETARPWLPHLHTVDARLAGQNISGAVLAWHDARAVALASRDWAGSIAVGDAFLSIGRAAGTPNGARPNARDAYLTALLAARRSGSIDGMLRTAEALRAIGDTTLAEGCLHVAAAMAEADERAQARIREARERWAAASAGS